MNTLPPAPPSAGEGTPLDAALYDPKRLAALHRTELLDSPPEHAFDRLTRLATRLLQTPVALVSLVDDHRQFFKSVVGLEITGTPLSHSFCKHVVALRAPLIIGDAREHPLVRDNPVIEAAGVVAYLGIPLSTPDGNAIGSLCAIDHVPRTWSGEDLHTLEELAEITMSEIALRQVTREQEASLEAVRESERFAHATVDALSAHICILDERGVVIAVNRAWRDFAEANPPHATHHGVGADYLAVCDAAQGERHAAAMAAGIRRVLAGEDAEFALEYPCHAARQRRWFTGRVTRFAGAGPRRVVVAHENITARKEAEDAVREAGQKLAELSRAAGMAEVATSVLHNVGNVLTSVNIAVSIATEKVRRLKLATLDRLAVTLHEQPDLGAFFTSDPRGAEMPAFLTKVAHRLGSERDLVLRELDALRHHIEHINRIVAMQQNHASAAGVIEVLPLAGLIEDALQLQAGSSERHGLRITRDYAELPPVAVDRHKVLQILVNLIRNASHALNDGAFAGKRLTLRLGRHGDRARITVSDNGVGIPAENLTRIFAHGFTTRKGGHGFGLHGSANAAREMGGSLAAQSDGPSLGAAFTLELPIPPHT